MKKSISLSFMALAAGTLVITGCAKEPDKDPNQRSVVTGYDELRSQKNDMVIASYKGTGEAQKRSAFVIGDKKNPYAIARIVFADWDSNDNSLVLDEDGNFDSSFDDDYLLDNHFIINQTTSWTKANETARNFVLTGIRPELRYEWRKFGGGIYYKCVGVLNRSAEAEMLDPTNENTAGALLKSGNQVNVYERSKLNQFVIYSLSDDPGRKLPITTSTGAYNAAYFVARAHCLNNLGISYN